ncbi:MAG: seryl-tRNA synthetase [Myxococcaceae bacterium]|nr:seryl-tRNA synthetase [Myxococcaceae bacterium]
MLDLRYVLDHLDEVRTALGRRSSGAAASLARIEELGEERKRTIRELEELLRQRNAESDAMAKIADKKSAEFAQKREVLRALGDRGKELEARQKAAQAEVEEALLSVPNLPYEGIPDGKSEHENRVLRIVGDKPSYPFEVKDHVDVGLGLGILDFERGVKITGARFTVLKGAGAQLERALMMYMLDLHTREHGYTEIWPPALVNAETLRGTGQLPKFEADLFKIANTGSAAPSSANEAGIQGVQLYLSPTAEAQLTSLHRDETLEPGTLPLKYTAYSPCFRSEAGSYGRDVRGLIRQHQFDKVELFQLVEPEHGLSTLEALTAHAEVVLQRLQLHYRVVELCAGDLGASARRTYDIEVWLPGQNAYREISSCSWFGDFQARRAKIRFRKGSGKADKPELAHTLNGSGLAIGRTLVALLEQHQQADGSVHVPRALVPYLGGTEVIKP